MNAEDAFINSKERNVFVETAPAIELLEALEQGLAHELPLIVLTGEAGLGKTTTVREAAARWADRVHAAWLDAGRVPVDALFGQTIRRFGGHFRGTDQRPEQVGRFAHALNTIHARKLVPVLVVDDAHELDLVALAELGRIESAAAATNVPFKLVLIGRPALLERLADEALQSLDARVGVRGTIGAMSLADTREYLAHRVEAAGGDSAHGFSKKAGREIHTASAGVPTVVNALSDEAQRCANAAGTAMVGPEHVRAVIAAAFRADAAPTLAPGAVQAAAEEDEDDVADAPPRSKSGSHARPAKAKEKESARPAIPEKPKVIASHKAPATPPSAAAHVPPPPTKRPATPLPKPSELDSSSPRVRDWVSRFTEGQPPVRFGGRIAPPSSSTPTSKAFDPDLVPPPSGEPVTFQSVAEELRAAIEAPKAKSVEPPTEAKAEAVEDAVVEPPVADAAIETLAENETETDQPVEPTPALEVERHESAEAEVEVAVEAEVEAEVESAEEVDEEAIAEAAAQALALPVPEATKLELIGLAPEVATAELKPVAIEVKPEQLASPPLQLDVEPAPWRPEPPPPASTLPPPTEGDLEMLSLTAAEVTPVVAAKAQAPVEEAAAPVARTVAPDAAPVATEPMADRRQATPRPFDDATAKSAPVATTKPVAAERAPEPVAEDEEDDEVESPVSAASTSPPAVERRGVSAPTSQNTPGTPSRKKQRAAVRRAERAARRAAEAAARLEKQTARTSPAPAQGSHVDITPITKPVTAVVAPASPRHAEPAKPAVVPPRQHPALERYSDGPRSPRHGHILTGVITGLIMLGMALMAIWLGRRGGFDSATESTPVTTASETYAPPASTVEVTPPVAVPVTPPVEATTPSATSTPVPAPPTENVSAPPPAPAPSPEEAKPADYCLSVGSYLFEDRARELARTLTRRTGQPARVLASGRGSERSYRILYGAYASEDAATRAADKLLARGIVTEALVEKVKQ